MGSTSRSNTIMTNLQKATLNVSEARAALCLRWPNDASAEDISPTWRSDFKDAEAQHRRALLLAEEYGGSGS